MIAQRFSRPTALVGMIAGYLLWSACFVALYALLSIGCELRWNQTGLLGISWLSLALVVVWGVFTATAVWLVRETLRTGEAGRETSQRFVRQVTLILHATAAAATLWIGLPILALPPCH